MSFKLFSFNDWLAEGGSAGLRTFALNSSYERMCWVYACVNRIATSASSAPLVFYEGKSDRIPDSEPNEKERIKDREHPAYKLFNPPNPPTILTLKQLMYRTFIHESIDGLVFWVIERKKGIASTIDIRLKNELRPILEYKNNNTTRPILRGWEDTNGKKYIPEDVLPIDSYNPKDSLAGLSRLNPARSSLESEFSIAGWNSAFFKSGMKNPLLIQSKGQLTNLQKKEIRSEVVNYYSGIDGAHGALLMQGSVEVKPLVVNPKDVDFIRGKELNREEILAVFGVPPAIVGIFSYANYCLSADTMVTLENNITKPIVEVKTGDKVLSMGAHQLEAASVINCWEAGYKDVYTIKTKFRTIKCSPDHKFLVRTTDGSAWIPAKDLYLKDRIAIVVQTPETTNALLPDGTVATKELMHQLGLFVGDGNISSSNGYQTGICIGTPDTHNKKLEWVEEAKRVWNANAITDSRCYRVCSVHAAQKINQLGFAGTSKTKRLPTWVYSLTTELKKSLIQGILETDGHSIDKGRYTLAFNNELLINDVRDLCISVGYHVNNVKYSYRESNYGPNPLWHLYINTSDFGKYLQKSDDLPKGLLWDAVYAIAVSDEQELMYDLEIEGTHNYFANWIVTHNSNVREQIRIFWEHTLLPKMNHILELVQFNILDRDFPGVYAAWDLSAVVGLAPDTIELAAPAKQYQDMGYSPTQIAKILKAPALVPDKDFKKPAAPRPASPNLNPNDPPPAPANPKKPPKDPNAGSPKPSDKPKPDNNNDFELDLTKRLTRFIEVIEDFHGANFILGLWNDLIIDHLTFNYPELNVSEFDKLVNLLCKKNTPLMRGEFHRNVEKIAAIISQAIAKSNSRL